MSNMEKMKYVKHNRARLKVGKREESTRMLLEFFNGLDGKAKGMNGFVIMDSLKDTQESIVLTFWERKEDMNEFYSSDNKMLADFLEKAKPLFDQLPERSDYQIAKFKVSQ